MKLREIGKVIGGVAVGQIEDHYIPYRYPMFGVDLVRVGLGAAQIGIAAWQEAKVTGITKDILDMVAVAGARLIVGEVAKAAGVASASPQIYVNKEYTKATVPAAPAGLVKID